MRNQHFPQWSLYFTSPVDRRVSVIRASESTHCERLLERCGNGLCGPDFHGNAYRNNGGDK
jgi:hypothetical protein